MFVLLSAISHKVGTGYSSYFQYITKYYFQIGKPKTYSDQAYNLDFCKERSQKHIQTKHTIWISAKNDTCIRNVPPLCWPNIMVFAQQREKIEEK